MTFWTILKIIVGTFWIAALPTWHNGEVGYGLSLMLAILLLVLLFAAPLGRIRRSAAPERH